MYSTGIDNALFLGMRPKLKFERQVKLKFATPSLILNAGGFRAAKPKNTLTFSISYKKLNIALLLFILEMPY